VVKKEMIQNF